jgi:proteasome assembly chaperone (PAC2) family protein
VGNIAVVHIIKQMKAKKFGEVYSPYFQDVSYSSADNGLRRPTIELHACKLPNKKRDLVILYGNTQPLSSYGQYEVSQKILSQVSEIGCRQIISLAGLKQEYVKEQPHVFCVGSGFEIMDTICAKGVTPLQGEVYGMAGVLIGLAKLEGMQAICLLAETLGIYADAFAAKALLEKINQAYDLQFDLSGLVETTKEVSVNQ